MHRQRFVLAACACVGMLGTFLPWLHAPLVGSIPGTAGEGWITFVLYMSALLLGLAAPRNAPLTGRPLWTALTPALLASGVGVGKIVQFKMAFAEGRQGDPMAEAMARAVEIGAGLYIVTAAGLVLTVLTLVPAVRR